MDVVMNEAVVELRVPPAEAVVVADRAPWRAVRGHGGHRRHRPSNPCAERHHGRERGGLRADPRVGRRSAGRQPLFRSHGGGPGSVCLAHRGGFPPRRGGAHGRPAGPARKRAFLRGGEVGRHHRRALGDGRLLPLLAGSARRATARDGAAHGGGRGLRGRAGDRGVPGDRQARTLHPRGWYQLVHRRRRGGDPLASPLRQRRRARSGASPVVRHRGGSRGRHRVGRGGAARAHQLARAVGCRGGGEHRAGADFPHGERVPTTGPQSGRMLVRSFTVFGFVAMVSAIYLVVVLGLGHKPNDSTDRTTLGLSMLATGIAALAFVPARERFVGSATRFVYGARQAPDEVLRTFGSRLTRAIPDGRALAAAGRIPPQDHGTGECRGVHRHGRSPGAGRFRSRFAAHSPSS